MSSVSLPRAPYADPQPLARRAGGLKVFDTRWAQPQQTQKEDFLWSYESALRCSGFSPEIVEEFRARFDEILVGDSKKRQDSAVVQSWEDIMEKHWKNRSS